MVAFASIWEPKKVKKDRKCRESEMFSGVDTNSPSGWRAISRSRVGRRVKFWGSV